MLDHRSPVPLYHQLKEALTRQVARGDWAPGQPIPPERELMATYQVSRTTVRQALDDLVAAGLLYRAHGRGTFVAERRIVHTLGNLTGFAEEMALRGLVPEIGLLSCGPAGPPPAVAGALGLPDGATAWRVERLVQVGGQPLFVDRSYFPPEFSAVLVPERLATAPIYRLLEEQGLLLVRGRQEIAAAPVSREMAERLGCPPGAPALVVTRVTYAEGDRPLEWSQAVYRSDRYQYEVELRRGRPAGV